MRRALTQSVGTDLNCVQIEIRDNLFSNILDSGIRNIAVHATLLFPTIYLNLTRRIHRTVLHASRNGLPHIFGFDEPRYGTRHTNAPVADQRKKHAMYEAVRIIPEQNRIDLLPVQRSLSRVAHLGCELLPKG